MKMATLSKLFFLAGHCVCVLVLALWILSYFRLIQVNVSTHDLSARPKSVTWIGEAGKGSVGVFRLFAQFDSLDVSPDVRTITWNTYPPQLPSIGPAEETFWRRMGFGSVEWTTSFPGFEEHDRGIIVPLYLVFSIIAAPILCGRVKALRKSRRGRRGFDVT